MTSDSQSKKSNAPRAGWVITGVAALVGVVLFAASRQPPSAPASDPAVVTQSTPAAKSPSPNPAGSPAPVGSANAPAPAAGTGAPAVPGGGVPQGGAVPQGGVAKGIVTPPKPEVKPEDLPPDHPPISPTPENQTSIQWLGLSCFYIHSPGGVAVVTDPFEPRGAGLAPPNTGAHLVTVSAEAPEHNNAAAVHAFQGETKQVLRGTGSRRGDMRLTPIPLYRDRSGGGSAGRTYAYLIESGGLRIAHLGDVGHTLTPAQLKALGKVDLLLVPAGGDGLSPKDAVEVTKQINPKIVIPMAVSTSGMEGAAARLRKVDDFIAASPWAVTAKDTDIMMISPAELPASTEIYTLRYNR